MVYKLHKDSTVIELFVVQFRNVYAKSSIRFMLSFYNMPLISHQSESKNILSLVSGININKIITIQCIPGLAVT